MDIDSIMNVYDMNSLWNSMNTASNSSSSINSVPLINNVDSTVNENYTAQNLSGQTTDSELQNIYKQIEPDYGIPLTYDSIGKLSIPTSTTLPTNGLSSADSNITSLLNSNESSHDAFAQNVLYQYDALEDGIFQSSLSSLLSAYSSDNNDEQTVANVIDASV